MFEEFLSKGNDGSTKCGFVSIVGAPNVGKSTLTNRFCESKISIVTPKAQTTRGRLKAIAIHGDTQIVFVDTPGIFKVEGSLDNRLNRSIVLTARNSFEGVDYIALVIDARKGIRENDEYIINLLKKEKNPKFLIINKIDLVDKVGLLDLSARLNEMLDFEVTFMISATKNKGVVDILDYLSKELPFHPWMYPEDQISDSPMRLVAAEITREKIFMSLQEELPYNCYVETELYKEDDKAIKINQSIYVKTDSHKRIMIGKKGALIKSIGEKARKELTYMTGKKVHLFLFVKVRENWMDNKDKYIDSGMDFSS